jgi:hypothetical protein
MYIYIKAIKKNVKKRDNSKCNNLNYFGNINLFKLNTMDITGVPKVTQVPQITSSLVIILSILWLVFENKTNGIIVAVIIPIVSYQVTMHFVHEEKKKGNYGASAGSSFISSYVSSSLIVTFTIIMFSLSLIKSTNPNLDSKTKQFSIF